MKSFPAEAEPHPGLARPLLDCRQYQIDFVFTFNPPVLSLFFFFFFHSIGLWLRCRQDVIPANVEAGLSAGLFPLGFTRLLTRIQRAVAPIAATLLAGGMSLYPKRTAFAEEPRDLVCLLE